MEIKKQDVNVGKAVFEGEIKSGADGSIIVPDVKPDILKVLQVDAEAFLKEKNVEDGKLILKGNVLVNVLYIPENEGEYVQCLRSSFEFCETVKRAEFESGMNVVADCEVSKVGYKLINSRKIGIESHILMNVSVTTQKKLTFVSDIESDDSETKKDSMCIKEGGCTESFTFKVEENAELPVGNAAEILKGNITVFEKDYHTLTGKVVVKGKACACVLYVTNSGSYEHFDLELPFTEVLDFEGIEEDCECDLTFEVLDTEFKLNENNLSANVEIRATVCKESCITGEYISDCYFTGCDCSFEYETIECEEVTARPSFSTMVKHVIEKDENAPDIAAIYSTVAKPYITSTDVENGRIAVSGKIAVCVLYVSDDAQNPLSGLEKEIPFNYMIDCKEATGEEEVLLKIECEHLSCTLNSGYSAEVRCGICISGRVIKKSKVTVISDISVSESEKKERAMIVYFVKENDTLWSIGKDYHVKCGDICNCNKISENEALSKGQKLLIPVTK